MFKSGNGYRRPLVHGIKTIGRARQESTALHFYQNRQLELYASKEANRLTLRQLVGPVFSSAYVTRNHLSTSNTGLFWSTYERGTIDQGEQLSFRRNNNYLLDQSANYVRTELPVRIAHRLRDLQALPYVVVTQEGVAKVYEVRHYLSLIPVVSFLNMCLALLVGI